MKAKHLTLEDRKAIQDGIENRLSKTAIARSISKDPTTISKEIMVLCQDLAQIKMRNFSSS